MNTFGHQAEHFLQNIFRHQQQQDRQRGHEERQTETTVPPASLQIRRQLPTIRVTPEDLVEVCNRECCICTESIEVHDLQTRLPCAHLFHPSCIQEWLERSCMCPICRYELPTDNPAFEAGRLERMRHRKPRFAAHELQKITIGELKSYAKRAIPRTILDKNGLIDYLVSTNCIELIPGNFSTVEYRLTELRSASIKKLREIMNQAGVFFNRKDIVEKEDMVQIFINSGRLQVLPEQPPPPPPVETVHSDDSDENDPMHNELDTGNSDTRLNEGLVMEEAVSDDEVMASTTMDHDDNIVPPELNRNERASSVRATSEIPVASNDTDRGFVENTSSLLETLMQQVSSLGTRELEMLHETIAQQLEDRHQPDV